MREIAAYLKTLYVSSDSFQMTLTFESNIWTQVAESGMLHQKWSNIKAEGPRLLFHTASLTGAPTFSNKGQASTLTMQQILTGCLETGCMGKLPTFSLLSNKRGETLVTAHLTPAVKSPCPPFNRLYLGSYWANHSLSKTGSKMRISFWFYKTSEYDQESSCCRPLCPSDRIILPTKHYSTCWRNGI